MIAILGAGIAGKVAGCFFKKEHPVVFDKKHSEKVFSNHKAVMRTSDQRIGLILGCDMRKITVDKAVLWGGKLIHNKDISAQNSYSVKVTGGVHKRSINNLETVDRFLFNDEGMTFVEAEYCKEVKKISSNKILTFADGSKVDYDMCISTIPIIDSINATGMDVDKSCFLHTPIFISRFILKCNCTVNQTLYIPDHSLHPYRLTLQEGLVIIESVGDFATEEEINLVLDCMGLGGVGRTETTHFKQNYGKLSCTDDDIRRSVIVDLTENFGIYSFGRFATWSNTKLDGLIRDLEQINKLIKISHARSLYEHKLNKLHE